MPRPTYPSDLAHRKTAAHVKVPLDAANRPEMAVIFGQPESRGVLLGLWITAGRQMAGLRGDVVHLNRGQIAEITGRNRLDHARKTLRKVCDQLGYTTSYQGDLTVIRLANFSELQGWHSAAGGATPRTPSASYSNSNSNANTDTKKKRSLSARATPDSFELAKFLAGKIRAVHPNAKVPSNMDGWALELDRMLRLDPDDRTQANARDLIEWALTHEFWAAQIRSAGALRKHWDTMQAQRSRRSQKQDLDRVAAEAAALLGGEDEQEDERNDHRADVLRLRAGRES